LTTLPAIHIRNCNQSPARPSADYVLYCSPLAAFIPTSHSIAHSSIVPRLLSLCPCSKFCASATPGPAIASTGLSSTEWQTMLTPANLAACAIILTWNLLLVRAKASSPLSRRTPAWWSPTIFPVSFFRAWSPPKFSRYAELRNDPDHDVSSGLSPPLRPSFRPRSLL
jgi:hypothetical protein